MYYFETTIKHENLDGKSVRETYLVAATTFGEAEAVVKKQFGLQEDEQVLTIRRSPIAEVHHEHDAGDLHRCKLIKRYADSDSGKEKVSAWFWALRALSTEEATHRSLELLQQGYDGFELCDIVKTKIVDVL